MKKVLIFIAGIVTGAILMLVIAALIGNSSIVIIRFPFITQK